MTDIDRVARALALVHGELSPTDADKSRLRGRILAPSTPSGLGDDAPTPSSLGLPPRTDSPLGRASRGWTRARWAALRASGRLGLTLGAALLGAGVAVGFWWGSEHAARSTESSSHSGARLAADGVREIAAASAVGGTNGAVATSTAVEGVSGADPSRAAALAPASASTSAEPGGTARAVAGRASPKAAVVSERARARSGAASERPLTRAAGTTPPRAADPPASDPAADELALLRRVERAIRAGEPALALALLDELDRRLPETRLGEERLAARCLAECRASEPGASERARRFLGEHPSSVYGRRLRLACALDHVERDRAERDEE